MHSSLLVKRRVSDMEVFIIILAILITVGIAFLIVELINYREFGDSVTVNILSKLPFKRNKLYKCYECKTFYRRYQKDIYYKCWGKNNCPHCEKISNGSSREIEYWMKNIPECPKIGFFKYYFVLMKYKKQVKKKLLDKYELEKIKSNSQESDWQKNMKHGGK